MIPSFWKKYFLFSFFILLFAYLISFAGYCLPVLGKIFFLIILLITFYCASKNLLWGLIIVLGELFIGSQGHLFSINIFHWEISLRIALFGIIWLVFIIKLLSKQSNLISHNAKNAFYLKLLFVFMAFIIWAFIIGLIKNNGYTNIYADGNGFIYLFYLIIFLAVEKNESFIIKIFITLSASLLVVALLTFIYFIIFAYQPFDLNLMYKWVRDTRLGEITFVNGNIYRIFLQAQIYSLIGLIIAYIFFSKSRMLNTNANVEKKINKWFLFIAFCSSLTTILSFSRSNWVGMIAAFGFFLLIVLIIFKLKLLSVSKIIAYFVLINAVSLIFLYVTSGNFSPALIRSRVSNLTDDSAGISRLNQLQPLWQNVKGNLILGAGFGKTITYQTNDPRILKKAPSGWYTTYAFEWGYLDLLLKFGIFGFFAYLLLLFTLVKKGVILLKTNITENQKLLITGVITGLIGISFTNIFSPYLNHPLGLGYLIITAVTIDYYVQVQKSKTLN